MAFGYNRYEKCPQCGGTMRLTPRVVVDEKPVSGGKAFLGAAMFGVAGAVVGAAVGKKKRRTMYVCDNMMCGGKFDPVEYKKWKARYGD